MFKALWCFSSKGSNKAIAFILGAIVFTLSSNPVKDVHAGLFSAEKKSKTLPIELGPLRMAYTFADKSMGAEQIEKEIQQELDDSIGNSWWEENKGKFPTTANKDEKISDYLFSLSKEEREELRKKAFLRNPAYVPSSDKNAPITSFEVWKRSNQRAQNAIINKLKLSPNDIRVGHKMSHHLDEKNVPYGGNFFPDNLGGISRRWSDGFMDELFDYKTFHEEAMKKVDDLTGNEIRMLKRDNIDQYKQFISKCKQEHRRLSFEECFQKLNPEWTSEQAKKLVIAKLRTLSERELNDLSPTEKYDLANGYYDFRTTMFEKYYKGKRRKPSSKNMPFNSTLAFTTYWEGRCNADRACGICNRHNEPIHKLTVDIDEIGKKLTFEPLDIKALFMSTYFYVENFAMMGERSKTRRRNPTPPNMAAFDVLLRGLFKENNFPFVIDNHNNASVNNVTVIGFDREVTDVRKLTEKEKRKLNRSIDKAINSSSQPIKNYGDGRDPQNFQNEVELYKKLEGATKAITVKTKLKLLSEVPIKDANGPTKKAIAEKGKFTKDGEITYDLYLNDNNEIVEGQYISGDLDFLWFADGRGTEEEQEDGNKLIKYDIMKDLAIKSSTSPQKVDRKIFPGQKDGK